MRATLGISAALAAVAILAVSLAAWFTHVWLCFTHHEWGFLIAGAIFAPIAVIHGGGHWFGLW